MRVGYAVRDITPEPGPTLCGFAARCERPSSGVDDPIVVHAFALENGQDLLVLLVYDLLALGPEIAAEIDTAVHMRSGMSGLQIDLTLCCTHTHSAPATIKLIGCGVPDRSYWNRLVDASAEVTREALTTLRRASFRYVALPVQNVSYNRRAVLADGRVVMTQHPAVPTVRKGPTWDRFLLVRFDDESGNGIAGIANWAAHPCVVCTQNISADYPGELRRRLSNSLNTPFLYLQGACGNINLPFHKMLRSEMLEDVDALLGSLPEFAWPLAQSASPSVALTCSLPLAYAPILARRELEAFGSGMDLISETGSGPDDVTSVLANILNVEPGQQADPVMMRYIAAALSRWAGELLDRYDNLPRRCDLALKVWRLGPLVFCFIAAEVFAETAIRLQEAFPDLLITTVGYASPLIGYLPTDEALMEGGYEVEYAYRFYGHPAPFAAGAEVAVLRALSTAIASSGRWLS
jgi:hypothetical protein